MRLGATAITLIAAGISACTSLETQSHDADRPMVIAHRGASGYLPEHTLESYALAHGMGADSIEVDVVLTKDSELICLHDLYLEPTTDVEDVFPTRAREDGRWYAADFSLNEIRSLRVHERLTDRFPSDSASFQIPTMEEMIELVQGLNTSREADVGVFLEIKKAQWHEDEGLPIAEVLLVVLRHYGYEDPDANIFVRSFEADVLAELREKGSVAPQLMMLGAGAAYDQYADEGGLQALSDYAVGIGVSKARIESDPGLVALAKDQGLSVYAYTFRVDQVPENYSSFAAELDYFIGELNVDGIVTDFPDVVRAWLDATVDTPQKGW